MPITIYKKPPILRLVVMVALAGICTVADADSLVTTKRKKAEVPPRSTTKTPTEKKKVWDDFLSHSHDKKYRTPHKK